MEEFVKQVYLLEVTNQCAFAIRAIVQANAVEKELDEGKADVFEYFRCLHGFLVHYGNVSLLFYPGRPRSAAAAKLASDRGAALRHLFGLPDPNKGHLLGNRELRNRLEHYDEYLDAWADADGATYVDMNIGPIGAVRVKDGHERHVMRSVDVDKSIFTFQDESFDLQAMVQVMEDLKTHADELLKAI